MEDMNDQLQRDLGRLEGTVEAQGQRIGALDAKIDATREALEAKIDANHTATNQKLDKIIGYQERQRGAGRLGLLLAGSLGTAAGLITSWFKS